MPKGVEHGDPGACFEHRVRAIHTRYTKDAIWHADRHDIHPGVSTRPETRRLPWHDYRLRPERVFQKPSVRSSMSSWGGRGPYPAMVRVPSTSRCRKQLTGSPA